MIRSVSENFDEFIILIDSMEIRLYYGIIRNVTAIRHIQFQFGNMTYFITKVVSVNQIKSHANCKIINNGN